MTDELHKIITGMGFFLTDPEPRVGEPEYHHPKYALKFRPVPGLDLKGLGEALIIGGMAVQKLETMEIISEAAKKLGFKL